MLARLVQLIVVVTYGGSEAKRSETHGAAGSYVGCVDLDVASKEIHDRIDAVRSCTSLVTIGKGADRCWNPRRLCSLVFGRIYYADRCWNPRTLCSIVPVAGSSTGASSKCPLYKPLFVLQGSREPDGLVLQRGRYVTVFGPAAAIGVNSRVSFADRLRSSMGVPILNFGRGGVGPGSYAKLLEGSPGFRSVAFHSAVVVIVVMAGRSSSDGVDDNVDAPLSREAAVKAFEGVDPGHATQLRNASMQNAEAGYVALARAIRRAAPAGASVEPKFVLLWMSQTTRATGPSVAASCRYGTGGFPQYFTCSSDRGERLRRIASSIDAQMIDAHTTEKRPPIPIDRCGCPPPSSTRNQTCTPKQARDEYGHGPKYTGKIGKDLKKPHSSMEMNASGENVLIGCSRHCARVQSPYYPNAAVHERAAEKLHPVLTDALSRRGPTPKA